MRIVRTIGLMLLTLSFQTHSDELPSQFIGRFHLKQPELQGAFNLHIIKGGTFFWSGNGCDSAELQNGKWKVQGDSLILEPKEKDKFKWLGKRVVISVKKVQLFSPSYGVISAQITTAQESHQQLVDNPQIWEIGEMCMKCEGFGSSPQRLCSEIKLSE